jgi:hypothetical protein
VLKNIIPNPMGVLTFGGVLRKVPNFIYKSKATTSLLGAAKKKCQTPLFCIETMAISCIEPMVVFPLVATLSESGGTPNVVVRSEDTFVPPIVPHIVYEANYTTKVSKVQPKSWHVAMAKL